MDIHTRFAHMHVPIQCYKVCVRFRFPYFCSDCNGNHKF